MPTKWAEGLYWFHHLLPGSTTTSTADPLECTAEDAWLREVWGVPQEVPAQ